MCNAARAAIQILGLGPGKKVLQFSSLGFDASVWEMFSALLSGAHLVLASKEALMPGAPLQELLQAQAITTATLTPSVLMQLEPGSLPSLETVAAAGEACTPELVGRWKPGRRFINAYGPTEVTICATQNSQVEAVRPTIGRALPNVQVYVLDEGQRVVPVGVAGELCVGGAGLARGYLGRAELTAERFIPNPYSEEPGARLYRTGDRVRWLENGELEFLGRMDFQVKLRGFRIELEEVEAALSQQPGLSEAVVVVREDVPGVKRLVAYVVGAGKQPPPSSEALRSALKQKLPEYMVPSAFVRMEALPLALTGKVDRRALPVPTLDGDGRREGFVEPRTEVERKLAEVWASVLKQPRVGVHDNFFELGGDSISSMQIVARAHQVGLKVTSKQLFQHQTIAELGTVVVDASGMHAQGVVQNLEPLKASTFPLARLDPATLERVLQQHPGAEDIYPLSPLQQGMLFHALLSVELGMYFEQAVWRFGGTLQAPAFRRAWQEVVDRNPILRTGFFWGEVPEPLQVVHPRVELPWQELDWREVPATERHTRLEAFLQEDRAQGFELSRPPMMRVAIVRMGDNDSWIIWSFHHILLDGWSASLLLKDLFELYGAFVQGQQLQLPPRPAFREYIAWLQGQDSTEAQAYWTRELQGFTAPTPLPGARSLDRTGSESSQQRELEVQLSDASTEAVQAFARKHKLTVNTVAQAAWALVLGRYSGEPEVVFGSTLAGRPPELTGAEAIVGVLINTLPVRVRLPAGAVLLTWLQDLQAQQLEQRQHQHCPLVQIQKWSEVPRERALFDSLFVFDYPMDASEKERLGILDAETFRPSQRTNYPLTATLGFPRGKLELRLAHEPQAFDAALIDQVLAHWKLALERIVAHPEQRLRDLQLLTADERLQVLETWNQTSAEYPREQCVHQLFEAQAERTPEAVAVRSGSEQVTYGELNRRANQLAHLLVKKGVGPETLVGLCTERTVDTVVGLLGILKAGGAYVPLDPAYPQERLAYMLEDTRAPVLVTQAALVGRFSELKAQVVCLDTQRAELEHQPEDAPVSGVKARNLAYVIYTSGSTGRPKGAMLEHQGVCNYLTWSAREYRVEEGQGAPVHSSISFDLTVTSLVLPLVVGRPVVMVGEEAGVEGLGEALKAGENYSLVKLTPTHLKVLAQQLKPEEVKGRTRAFIIGGEGLSAESLRYWREHAPQTRLINEYGPTETVVGCSIYEVGAADAAEGAVPIGHPIANTQLYVLDGQLQVVPKGVAGELYIGGEGVGRGYLGRPELTAERFMPDPFSRQAGARLYKTGDLVKRQADGKLEYLGRLDTQVKVRGYRIELGEIEAVLAKHPAVHEAVVVVREDGPGGARLVAYVTAHPGQTVREDELRALLSGTLPEYMVPAAFMVLETLPVTQNGKVDRRALPAPVAREAESFSALRSPSEELVAGIWAQLLGVPRVGRHDNFFALGGHSLLAMQTASRLRNAFQMELPLRWLFEAPTVSALAQRVDSARHETPAPQVFPLAPVPREQPLPLSFSQQRLWFLDQLSPGDPSFNLTLAARVTGPLDAGRLEWSLRELSKRHEALRTTFATVQGQTVQLISPEPRIQLNVVDLSGLPGHEQEAEVQRRADEDAARPFDLTKGPLLRAQLLCLAPQEGVLLLALHHIVTDGWSMGLFFKELGALYEAHGRGEASPLPALSLQYADYAVWQRNWLSGEVLEGQLAYWSKQLSGAPAVLELPTDRPRPAVRTTRGALAVGPKLPSALIRALRGMAQKEGVTFFMLMEAAFHALLHRYSGQEDISVGTTIAGRNRTETEPLIGLFINTLVLRVNLGGDPTFRELLGRVREVALGAYAHQDVPFERLVDELAPTRSLSHSPLFQVVFDVGLPAGGPPAALADLKLSPLRTQITTTKFDLAFLMVDHEDGMVGLCQYSTELYEEETIQRMLGHLTRLLEAVAGNAEQR
ncbi:amino acid adenylation domain-containing protein, partial [Stigmatella aurantiaca]